MSAVDWSYDIHTVKIWALATGASLPIRTNGQLTAERWGPLCRAPEEESQKSEGNGNSHRKPNESTNSRRHKPKESTSCRRHKPKESTDPRHHQPISPHSPNGFQSIQ